MRLSLDALKSLVFGKKGKGSFQKFSREDFIFWGLAAVFSLFLLLLFWDGYLFYRTALLKRGHPVPQETLRGVSRQELDDIIKLLDLRQKKFEEILSR